jgi:hypothetical protein
MAVKMQHSSGVVLTGPKDNHEHPVQNEAYKMSYRSDNV